MKKIILFALTALIMVGCSDKSDTDDFKTIVVDSCEYLYEEVPTSGGVYAVMTHKGNCKFCEKRDKQKIEELIKKLKEM